MAVGFTLAKTVRDDEETEDDRPKCLVFEVKSENPLRLWCYCYNKSYADGTAENKLLTRRENSTELWANDAFAQYGSGLDHSGIVERNVWKELVLAGATDRLEECSLPVPLHDVNDYSVIDAHSFAARLEPGIHD